MEPGSATCPSPARSAAACPGFGCSVRPASVPALSRVPAPGEPRPLPGVGPAPVCAGIMALYFHELSGTGCAGRRRQPRGMKAPPSHRCGGGIAASPSAWHSVLALPAGGREGDQISSARAPANPPAPSYDAPGAKSLQGHSEPRTDSCC